jgi:hypothetical protein
MVERGVDVEIAHEQGITQRDQLASQFIRKLLRYGRVAVGIDEHLGTHVGHVARRKALHERDSQNAVVSFERLDALDQ